MALHVHTTATTFEYLSSDGRRCLHDSLLVSEYESAWDEVEGEEIFTAAIMNWREHTWITSFYFSLEDFHARSLRDCIPCRRLRSRSRSLSKFIRTGSVASQEIFQRLSTSRIFFSLAILNVSRGSSLSHSVTYFKFSTIVTVETVSTYSRFKSSSKW